MPTRYGGEVKPLVSYSHRVTNRIPTFEEMLMIERGQTERFTEQEVIDLLLNYIQNLEAVMEERLY